MNDKGCKRAYIRSSKAYYAILPNERERVMVGMYHPEGGTSGEFEFEWILLDGKKCARLNAFEDSWASLWLFKDLLEKMSEIDSEGIQEPEFCQLLNILGIIDITEYEHGCPKNPIFMV